MRYIKIKELSAKIPEANNAYYQWLVRANGIMENQPNETDLQKFDVSIFLDGDMERALTERLAEHKGYRTLVYRQMTPDGEVFIRISKEVEWVNLSLDEAVVKALELMRHQKLETSST